MNREQSVDMTPQTLAVSKDLQVIQTGYQGKHKVFFNIGNTPSLPAEAAEAAIFLVKSYHVISINPSCCSYLFFPSSLSSSLIFIVISCSPRLHEVAVKALRPATGQCHLPKVTRRYLWGDLTGSCTQPPCTCL